MAQAAATEHFGRLMAAYRKAHRPVISQSMLGMWLGMTQAQVSRLERAAEPPTNLIKLQRWSAVLQVPPTLLWFAASHTRQASTDQPSADTVEDVHRRDMLKLTGAAAVATTGILSDTPWQRLADSLAGRRPADAATVNMVESQTAAFFRSEETMPARQLIMSLRSHHASLKRLIESTQNPSLRQRLITSLGETEALAGWTLFDLQRPDGAVRLYRDALQSAKEAGDGPLAACTLGYWSYLHSSRGDAKEAARVLSAASDCVKGSAAATQAWVTARRAEEQAAAGDGDGALRSLDSALTVFDYATPLSERPWTCFFTPSRLGSLAVSTYGRMRHPGTEHAADDLLASLAPSDTKVKALVLADLATISVRAGELDRMQAFTDQSAPLAGRTEASVAIDRLWDLVELIPNKPGVAAQARTRLTDQLLAGSSA